MGEEGNKEVSTAGDRWPFIRGKWGNLVYELLPGSPVTNLISHTDFMDQSYICTRQDKMHNQAVKRWAHSSFGRLQHSEGSPALRASHQRKALPLQQRLLPGGPGADFVTLGRKKTAAKLCILAKRAILFAIQREQIWHAVVLHYAGLIAPVQHKRASLPIFSLLHLSSPLCTQRKARLCVSTASATTYGSYTKSRECTGVFSNRTFHFESILQHGLMTRDDLEVCASQTGWTRNIESP